MRSLHNTHTVQKLFLFVFLALLSLPALAQDNDGATFLKTFVPDMRIFNFGTINEKDGKVSHTFYFKNTGKKPVVINEAAAFCSCTTAKWQQKPMRPGEQGTVTVTYNPFGRPGKFSKEVVLKLNNGANYVRCWVKGTVIGYEHPIEEDFPYSFGEGLRMSLSTLAYIRQHEGKPQLVKLRMANTTNKPMTVEFARHPNNVVLKMPQKVTLKPNERKEIITSYAFPKKYTYNRYIMLDVKVNGKKVRDMKVWFYGTK